MRGWLKVYSPDRHDVEDPNFDFYSRYCVVDFGKSYFKVFMQEPSEETLTGPDNNSNREKRASFNDPMLSGHKPAQVSPPCLGYPLVWVVSPPRLLTSSSFTGAFPALRQNH